MSPSNAALLFSIGIAGLIFLDRDRDTRTSLALWLPMVWVAIGATRMVSQWLGADVAIDSPDQLVEGSPLDRWILSGLLAAAFVVLFSRREQAARILRANGPILLFLLYCVVSVSWSDYPFVALKRVTKAIGNIAMVLIVLTEPDPRAAIRRLFARVGFVLIPLSVLLIKYYPQMGREYDRWTGTAYYSGAAIGKNGLGYVCLVFGLPALWRVIAAFRDRLHRWRQLLVHGTILAMTLWLLNLANSSTSTGALLMGGTLLIFLASRRRTATIHFFVATIVLVAVAVFAFGADAYVVRAFGRDSTLTGRTVLWDQLWRMDAKPLLGFGYESFWLGDRARYFWNKYTFHPNQAHNGYIEVYLNLGWVGITLLALLMVRGYGNAIDAYRRDSASGSLKLAFFLAATVYNLTEAAFKVMHPVWIAFLVAITRVPDLPRRNDG